MPSARHSRCVGRFRREGHGAHHGRSVRGQDHLSAWKQMVLATSCADKEALPGFSALHQQGPLPSQLPSPPVNQHQQQLQQQQAMLALLAHHTRSFYKWTNVYEAQRPVPKIVSVRASVRPGVPVWAVLEVVGCVGYHRGARMNLSKTRPRAPASGRRSNSAGTFGHGPRWIAALGGSSASRRPAHPCGAFGPSLCFVPVCV